MDFEAGAAVGAGLVGGGVMVVLLYMGRAMMPTQMRMDLLRILGTMTPMSLPLPAVYLLGGMMHAGASLVFGLVHGGVYAGAEIDSSLAAWGLLFGAVHWLLAGMALGMMRVMHPRIADGTIADPGPFAARLGPMTAAGFLVLHLVFGILVGVLYEAWV